MSRRSQEPYPECWRRTRLPTLAAAFESLRRFVDGPLVVRSGYSTPKHNRAIGGARNSQHLEGRALDLSVPAGMTAEEFHASVREWSEEAAPPSLGAVG